MQQTLNTKNLWLNVVITHFKFISSPFICLFSTITQIVYLLHPYIETTLL